MNDQSKSKYYRVKRNGTRIKLARETRQLPSPLSRLSPARQFMISLGWLRLFQVIISPSQKSFARRQAAYET
jgi:hypothetical protein